MQSIKIIRQADMTPTLWAGGKTIQLLIYPEGSNYPDRNFTFRLSTATVEQESSTFTRLEGVQRWLMVLKGTLQLTHQGHYTKTLQPFDVDSFSGSWESTSLGKVTDFNLMTRNGAEGILEHKRLEANAFLEEGEAHPNLHSCIYYLATGEAQVYCDGQAHLLQAEELIWITGKLPRIRIEAIQPTHVVAVRVKL